ncbi:1,3-beta-glucanosyltransferase [Haplosporangium sp. Z 767]|nr:1,3-beta-glucanosyltransferase [Haplosporangium sp. Z 767]
MTRVWITATLLLIVANTTHSSGPDEFFKIPIEVVQGPVRLSTMSRWMHTLRKYGIASRHGARALGMHGHQRGRLGNETNLARIPLVDYDFDRGYYGTVQIGQPPQSFKIDFDTGSSQFIISTKNCVKCSGTARYDPTTSKTFRANGQPWNITYGDRSRAEGFLGHDMIILDGITVKNQQLAMITKESAGFDDIIDGIMGLAFGSLSTSIKGTRTVFENMVEQKLVDRGIFSFYLGKVSLNGGGEVIFGGLDMSRVEHGHNITYTPVTRAKYWQINVSNVYVDGVAISRGRGIGGIGTRGKSSDANFEGIMDTGTTLMIVPLKLAREIHRRINGSQELASSWAVPCDLAKQNPGSKVELEIEGKRFGIPFEDLVREGTTMDESLCYSGIQTSSANFIIIGDVFIKNNYVVFDQENKRVGIAPLRLEER